MKEKSHFCFSAFAFILRNVYLTAAEPIVNLIFDRLNNNNNSVHKKWKKLTWPSHCIENETNVFQYLSVGLIGQCGLLAAAKVSIFT